MLPINPRASYQLLLPPPPPLKSMLKSYLSNFCLKTRALSSFRSLKALGSLLLLLFVGTEAQGILLVGNFSQPTKTDNNGNAEYHSYTESHLLFLGFSTPNTHPHTLTAIKIIIAADGKAPRTIELREASRNNPAITTFSVQGTYTGSGTNTYIPDKDTVLKKDTVYFFALGHSKGGWGHVVQTSSNNEDATLQVNWAIGNAVYSERERTTTGPAAKIEVHGNYFAPSTTTTLAAGGILLSNIDGGRHSGVNSGRQEFTTGSWPNGYKIRSIEVYGQQSGTLTSQGLYQGDTKVADFTAAGTPTTVFTPTKSLTLAPKTTYSFRVSNNYWLTSGSISAHTGWSLGAHSPAASNNKMRIRITADEAIAPAVIATPKTLVSNIKQSRNGLYKPDTTTSLAQAFRTGINPYGYALRGMEVLFGSATAPPTATVHENSPTGKKVTTFEPPHGGSPLYGLPDYVVLKKTTTYYVVFSGGNAQLRATQSDHIDSDSLAAYKGWNIANAFKWSQNGSAWRDTAGGEAIRLRIAGEPLASPPSEPTNVQRAIENGQIVLTWEPPLVNNYAPLLNYRINYKKTKDPNYSSWKDYPANARSAVIASLTNGEQYDFQIRARSSEGLGPIFKTTATPNSHPSPPRNFKARTRADNNNGVIYLSWDAPTTGNVGYYQYRYHKSGTSRGTWTPVPGGASARSAIIGGLQRNASYVLQLQAVNSRGATTLAPITRTVALTINPPTNLRIKSASTTEATFTWDHANVDSSIYQYRYKRGTDDYPLAWTDIASGLEQTITGLTIGPTYTFQVRTADQSNISTPITLALTPLPPPQNFEVLTGPSKVYFSWDAPATGTVGSYEYFYESTWNPVPGGASARNLAVEISGFDQVLYLRAISNISVGLSVNSGEISVTPVASPTNFRVKSSTPTQATLVWDSAVDTSQIRYKTGTNDYPFAWTDITSGREQTITGLTPGTAHTFQLRSKVGTAVSAPLTVIPVPAPPRNPSATAGYAQVTLKWDAPNTGPTPTGYQYNYLNTSDNALTYWTDVTSGREQTITGLTPGTSYIFSLRAKVANGNGSATTITATPLTAPPAPQDLIALPHDQSITLTWDSTHSSFEYRYKTGSNAYSVWADTRNSSTHVISGLTNNAAYTIEVRGKPSGPTTTATATPATVDFTVAPSSFVATSSGDGAVTLTWAAPSGGFPDGYLIRYKSTGGYSAWATRSIIKDWDGTSFSRTISGLSNGTAYTFEIQGATSNPDASVDRTPNATATTPGALPNPPQNPVATAGYAQVALAWQAPATGPTPTGYQYRLKVATDSSYGLWKDVASGREQTITGLTVGTAYLFQVRSKNTTGSSSPLTFASTTPLTPPSAPEDLIAVPRDQQIDLYWSSTHTSYESRYKTGSNAYNTWADTYLPNRDFTRSLTNNVVYTIELRAKYPLGPSATATVTATPNPADRTAVPPNFVATPSGNGAVTLTWDAPPGGFPPLYEIRHQASGGSYSLWDTRNPRSSWNGTNFSITISSLTNGTAYTFEIRGQLSQQVRTPTATTTATPGALPNPPRNPVATAGYAQATLTWDAPATGPAPASYQYRLKVATASSYGLWKDVASGREQTITGLTVGTAYLFQVRSKNTAGNSSPLAFASTTPLIVPPAPQDLRALPRDKRIDLYWSSTHTSFEYRYQAGSNDYSAWADTQNSVRDIILGLTNNVVYTIEVRAKYPLGPSATATAMATPNPLDLAATPSNFAATPSGDGAVTLTWDAPSGGFPAGYQVRYKASGGSYNSWASSSHPIDNWNGTNFSRTVSGLTNGTAYTFELEGLGFGSGRTPTATAMATPSVPTIAPNPPRNPVATAGYAQATLTWDAPATGFTPTGYQYRLKVATASSYGLWKDVASGQEQTIITGLTPSTAYLFQVRSKNAVDGSSPLTFASTTPLTPPSAPQNLRAVPGDQEIGLYWTHPHNSFESRYQAGSNAYSAWADTFSSARHALGSLTNDLAHTFEVRAKYPLGPSATATITATPNPLDLTAIPSNFVANPSGDRAVTLTWDAPLGGFPDRYRIRYKASGGSYNPWATSFHIIHDWNGTNFSRTISGLTNGTTYTFELQGLDFRNSPTATATATATPSASAMVAAPNPPRNLLATAGYAQVTLDWDAPATGFTPTGYQYRSKVATDSSYGDWTDVVSGRKQTIIEGLTVGTAYAFEVRATNMTGNSSPTLTTATPLTPPPAPRDLRAIPVDQSISLHWSTLHTSFEYRYKAGSNDYSVWADTRNYVGDVISSLTNNVAYTIELRGKYPLGPGATATVTATPNPISLTATPSNFVATPSSDGVVTLTWDAPSGGFPAGYRIRYKASGDSYNSWSKRLVPLDWNGTNLSRTISGLTNGTAYTFELQGLDFGNSPTPTATAMATPSVPTIAPNPPRNPVATAGHAQATLAWDAPATGFTPTGYQYRLKVATASSYGDWKDVASGQEQTITALTVGTAYLFQVRSKNTAGNSSPLAFASTTPLTPPSAPQNLRATPRDQHINFYWSSTHTSFESRYKAGSNAYSAWADTFSPNRDFTSSLTNDLAYTFEVRAKYPLGPGAIARVTATPKPVDLTAIPSNFVANPSGDRAVTLTWDAPLGGFPDRYRIRYKASGSDYVANSWAIRFSSLDWNGNSFSRTITNLTNGTAYTFELEGTKLNSRTRTPAATATATPSASAMVAAPNPPRNLLATVGYAQVTLDWDAPATGFSPTGYQYRSKVATDSSYGDWTDVASGRKQTIIEGLTGGTAYAFEVRATNMTGNGSPTLAINTPLTPPSAPRDLRALPDDQQTIIHWRSTHNSYESRYKTGSNAYSAWTDAVDSSYAIIGDLTNNVAYTFEVRAKYPLGPGATATIMATPNPIDFTAIPSNLVATPSSDGVITLTWDAPSEGFPVFYQVRYKSTGAYNSWMERASFQIWNGTNFSRAIGSLTNGTTYTFELKGKGLNSVTTSLDFTPIATAMATPSATATPTAPQNLTATPASTQVTLAWTAPATGTPTGYQYRQKTSGGSYADNWADTSGRTSTLNQTITSLTNNTTYNFQVRAKSDSGSGTEATVNSTPNNPPAFSSSATASVNEGTISVATLTATDTDTDDNTFTYSIIGGADSAKFSLSAAALSFKTAPDFENPTDLASTSPSNSAKNNEYIVTLSTTSGSGDREISTSQTLTITVADTDEAPEAPAVPTLDSPTPTTLTLNWTAPTNAGPPITDYDYRYRAGNAGAWNIIANDINDALTFTITTLTASTSYQVGIRATNAEGTGDWSTSTAFTTPAAPPSAPQSLTAAPANTQVTLAWTAPASGTPTGYEYRYKSSGDYNSWTDTTSPKIIASLTNNTPYTFEVRAKSNSGPGAKATVSATPTAPNDPPTFSSLTTASVNEGTTAVTTLTATDPDSDDTTFTYSIFGGADSAKFSINSSSGALTFKTAPDFENPTDTTTNNEYIITLRVTSGSNAREMTTEQTLTVTVADTDEAPEAPAAPTFTSLTSTTLTLNWIAPTNTGPPITDYDYRYSTDGNSWTTIANTPIDAISTPIVGLSASTLYYVAVRATNAEGTGSWSTSTSFTTLAAPPSAPQSLTAAPASTQVTLAWTAPASGTPTGYQYRYKSSGGYNSWTDTTSPKIIASLTNNTPYTFEVRAKSDSGPGAKATVSATPTAPNDPPTFSSLTTASVNEGTTAVTTLTATDPDSDDTTFTYSIFGGADSAKFSINSSSGALTFKTAPDFENPTDTTTNNEYIITLRVTSGSNAREMTTEQTLTVTVADTDEAPAAPDAPTFTSLTSATLTLNWTAPTNTGPPITDYDYRYSTDGNSWTTIANTPIDAISTPIVGLSASTLYYVAVRATNAEGTGSWSTSTTFTTPAASVSTVPSAPQSLMAQVGNQQITLAWEAPATGVTPTGYEYRYKSSGAYGNWTDTTSPKIIASLTNNTPYTFEVRAKSNSGSGAKATVSATPIAPNDPPTFSSLTTASVNEGTTAVTTLTATDPDDTTFTYSIFGGADSAKFSINSSSGALTFKTAPDFENPTDTTTNNEYIITLRVTSGSNPREMTTEQTLTITVADTDEAPEAPAAPTFTSLTSTTLTLNWIAPTNTGPPITDYDYRYRAGNAGAWNIIANDINDALTFTFTTLTASTSYQVGIRATNAEGDSDWSTSTSFTTPAAPPSAPQSLTAAPANTQVTLAWTAPASGTPTGYEYRYKSSGDYNSWTDTTSPKIIASLTNNTPYTFEVRAKSNSGSGAKATVSATPTAPNDPPTFSSLTTASVNEGTTAVTTLTATDPDSDDTTFTYSIFGGADSAKFSINSSSGALTFKTAPDFENPTDTTTNNEYIITLRVTSGSNPREMTTEQTLTVTVADTDEAPEAPAAPTLASRTPTTLTLNWTAPTNAGPPITDYDYRYRAGNAGAWNIIANDINDALTFTFTTLTASTSYQVGIRATNAEGTGDWSTSTAFTTPAAPPTAPQSLTAAPASTQVTLAWTAPASGTPTGYEYRYKSSGDYNSWTDTTSPKIIASLTNNTPYTFEVRAKSNSGPGAKATVSATPTAPNDPPTFSSLTTASVNEGTTAVTTLTATDPDSDDTTFTYSIFGGADSAKFSINSSSGALTFKTAPDFENPTDTTTNNEYIITLRVTSGSNPREMTTEQTLTVTVADTDEAPEAPAVPTLDSRTSTTLTLDWIAPANTGPPITDYDYRYRAGNAGAWNTIANDINDALTFTITTLTASTSYQVGIRATNDEGDSDWSTSTSFTTLAAPPSAPQSLTAAPASTQVTLAWTAPASGTPTGYEYRYKSSGAYGNWTPATSPKIIASLINNTTYNFQVRAKSNSGPGTEATVSATPIASTAPNSPPTFTSLTTATVNEGTTAVTTLIATDPDDTTFTYSIVAGADSAQFSINSSSGALSFKTAPNFENPTDTTSNNEYIVTLSVTSGSNPREITTEQTLTITVTDTNEVPTFTSPNTFDIVENQNTITTLIATDPDGDDNTFTYSILGGADNAKFSLSGATLSFKTAPNFEATQSSANTNTYTLIVTATSGSGNRAITTEQTLTINVTDDTTSNDPIDQKAIGQPIITGSPQIGQRLTTSTTTIDDPIDGLTQPQYTYQWIRIEENGNEVVIQSANSYAYTPTQGDLGRTLKVRVEFIDDSGHSEILTSNATAAVTETTSTKELSAWLTRFGRATADQILNTVEERLRAYRSTGITLHFAGQHLPTHLTEDPQHPTENGVYSDSLLSWLTYGTKDQIQSQNMTEQELLMNSSFDLSAGNQENGFASLWGRMSQSTFQGYQNSLQLDGDITTGLLGADYTRGPWTAGLILSRSKGKGNYQGDTTGKAKASLNSLTPWAAYTGADQLSIWAATGYGKGDISLIPQEGSPQKTDIKLLLAALGTRGTLLDPSTGPRIELFSDARWVQTTSKSTTELKATQTHTARLRLGLEGSWYTTLSTGSVLIPRLTLGLRKDSGDAETGFGTDIGTHITLAMPQGLTLSLEARGLLSHQAKGFQDQGWSGTLQWDSKPDSEQGFTLSLSQSKGAASSGGTHALFAHETLEQLTLTNTDTKLIQANIAYGLPPFGNQLTARSELTLGLSDTTRQYSLAWHVSSSYLSAQSFDLSLQGTRHESIDGALAPRHSLGIQLGRQW